MFDNVALLFEFRHDTSVGWDAVAVVSGLEGLNEDGVGAAVVGEHDVLVATARADGEAAHVVGEELTEGTDLNVKFVGSSIGKRSFDDVNGWKGKRWIGLSLVLAHVGAKLAIGGVDAMLGLYNMASDGFGA